MNFDNPLLVSELERKAYLAGDSLTGELLAELVSAQKIIEECDKVFEMFGLDRELVKKTLAEQAVSFMEVHDSYRRALINIQDVMGNAHFNEVEALDAVGKVMDNVDMDAY